MKRESKLRIRRAKEEDVSVIDEHITKWLKFDTDRVEPIKRAIKNKELLVADLQGKLIGFIHYVMHEDIIDGGPNSFITAFYVVPEFQHRGIGSSLLQMAIEDALGKGALGIEASTANPDAKRLYEKHHFEQFMGQWTMGEVFLELNISKYRRFSVQDSKSL